MPFDLEVSRWSEPWICFSKILFSVVSAHRQAGIVSGRTAMPTLPLSEEEGRPWGSRGSDQPGAPVLSSTSHCSGCLAVGSGSSRSPVLPPLSTLQPRTLKRLEEWISERLRTPDHCYPRLLLGLEKPPSFYESLVPLAIVLHSL